MKKDEVKHDLQDWMQKLEVKGQITDKIKVYLKVINKNPINCDSYSSAKLNYFG